MAEQKQRTDLMDKIVSLCKRRGFVFPGSEIYGGLANSWDYGPLGVELRNNIKQLWWNRYVHQRDDIVGLEAAIIMNPKVWEQSGHLQNFIDPLIECKVCHGRFRWDPVLGINGQVTIKEEDWEKLKCATCGAKGSFSPPKRFNLMFKTFIGAVDPISEISESVFSLKVGDDKLRHIKEKKIIDNLNEAERSTVYLRPETAQGMFVDFKQVLDTTRKTLPFGIAQQGKAFRNEITPGNFIFRTREFEQMEIEYFISEPQSDADWQVHFEYWQNEMHTWMKLLGLDMKKVKDEEIPDKDRAHYSKRTIDFMYTFPFGQKELYGLAYRTDFDLRNHFKDAPYRDQITGNAFWPHVIEPTWGVDRTLLAILCDAYSEDGDRVILKFKPYLAPYKAAVFPLLGNKPDLTAQAKEIYADLKKDMTVAWDDRGNIGKRYYAQDEIGTPWCVTVDFQTLQDHAVTVRDRDTAKQERVSISDLKSYIMGKMLVPDAAGNMPGA